MQGLVGIIARHNLYLQIPHDNYISFWYTMMILHTWVDHDPRRTSIDFGSIGPRSRSYLDMNFLPFPHDNSISFCHTMMILHTCTDHDPRRTSMDLGVNRSNAKVIFGLWTFYRVYVIAPFRFLSAYNDDTSHSHWPWPEKDVHWFWGQRSKVKRG